MKLIRLMIPFLIGFFLYSLIEIAARGYTHWTMALTGGVVLVLLCILFRTAPRLPSAVLYLCGAFVITAFELTVGMIVNVHLHWNVWDYSAVPYHFCGQICPLYSCFWFLLCIPARSLAGLLDGQFARMERSSKGDQVYYTTFSENIQEGSGGFSQKTAHF